MKSHNDDVQKPDPDRPEPNFDNIWRLIRAVTHGRSPMRSSDIAKRIRVPVGIVWECISRRVEAELIIDDDGIQRWRIA